MATICKVGQSTTSKLTFTKVPLPVSQRRLTVKAESGRSTYSTRRTNVIAAAVKKVNSEKGAARFGPDSARYGTSNWDGDHYLGGRWNALSIGYLIFLLTPLAGLVFAYLTYGTLWTGGGAPIM